MGPCILVLLIVCRRRSLPWLLPPSRSSLHQRGSTPSGSEVPFWLLSPPSNRCGSPSRSMMNVAPPSCTGNASKYFHKLHIIHSAESPSLYNSYIFVNIEL